MSGIEVCGAPYRCDGLSGFLALALFSTSNIVNAFLSTDAYGAHRIFILRRGRRSMVRPEHSKPKVWVRIPSPREMMNGSPIDRGEGRGLGKRVNGQGESVQRNGVT